MRLRFLVLIACMGAASVAAVPARWQGVVTRVTDGDSLWVRPSAGGAPQRIRLHGIDAPEICQAYGLEARAALQRWVKGRELELQVLRTDDYGRPITRVTLQGADVARALVREGHAWSYRWRRSPGPYAQEEAEARSAGRGLFAAREPQRPYDFRRSHGPCERR
jgi:micrococcal nuclease